MQGREGCPEGHGGFGSRYRHNTDVTISQPLPALLSITHHVPSSLLSWSLGKFPRGLALKEDLFLRVCWSAEGMSGAGASRRGFGSGLRGREPGGLEQRF